MNKLREWWRQLRFRLMGQSFDADLAEEMRLHLDLRAAEKQTDGISPAEAESSARRRFGNATLLREKSRDAWGWTSLDTWLQDLRYAIRTLIASPGFAVTVVLSLALGIGANTAIFSILNAVMLRSLPVEDPHGLVKIQIGESDDDVTNPIWEQVRDHQQAFSGTLAYSSERFDLAAGGESRFTEGMWVSGDFFRVLGVPAMEGRVFSADDDRRGAEPLAVISYSFWQRNLGGDAGALGKTVRLNRHLFTIVGVTPPWFTGLDVDHSYDVAIPIACNPMLHTERNVLDSRLTWWLQMIGRIPAGESISQAQDRMRSIAPEIFRATVPLEIPAENQKEYRQRSFSLKPAATGFSETGAQYRTALLTLMAIVGLVLLIACANVANLLLARAAARQRELSVRMSMGAGRWRVIRQLMTESIFLSAIGSTFGFLLALWGSRLLVHMLSTTAHPLEINLSPDPRVLAFTIGVTLLTALLFGFAPAVRATKIELNQVLKESARAAVPGARRFNLSKLLVTGQVALSLVLLVGAGLFLGTLRNLLTLDAGFTRRNILLVSAEAQEAGVPEARRLSTFQEILARLQSIPGVVAAASSSIEPMGRGGWAQLSQPEGFVAKSPRDTLLFLNRVSSKYFETMRTPLLLGRDFNDRDNLNSAPVVIVSESTARKFFSAANPIGKTIGLEGGAFDKYVAFQVIGVAKDAKYNRLNESPRSLAYFAAGQDPAPWSKLVFEIRSETPVEALIPAVRSAVGGVNKDIALVFRSFETQVNESMLQPRVVASLASTFAGLALVLAMVGLYGVTAYAVTRRSGEIGIRMALGAQRTSVIWLILRDVMLLLGIGMVFGLAGSLAAGRLVTSLLYGVRPNNPAQLTGAVLTLALCTALAAYLPARRAAQLDPMNALRDE
jgi:predicted permease